MVYLIIFVLFIIVFIWRIRLLKSKSKKQFQISEWRKEARPTDEKFYKGDKVFFNKDCKHNEPEYEDPGCREFYIYNIPKGAVGRFDGYVRFIFIQTYDITPCVEDVGWCEVLLGEDDKPYSCLTRTIDINLAKEKKEITPKEDYKLKYKVEPATAGKSCEKCGGKYSAMKTYPDGRRVLVCESCREEIDL